LKTCKEVKPKTKLTTLEKLKQIMPGLNVVVIKNPVVVFKKKRRAQYLAIKQSTAKLRCRSPEEKMASVSSVIALNESLSPLRGDDPLLQWIGSDRASLEHPDFLRAVRQQKNDLIVMNAVARDAFISEKVLSKEDSALELSREKTKEKNWWNTYKLTPGQYQDMLIIQGGGCKICGAITASKKIGCNRSLVVDHCHESEWCTGTKRVVRGLLCSSCNFRVGAVETKIQEGQLSLREIYQQIPSLKKYSPTHLVSFKEYIDQCISIIASLRI
jgi:hypothetical protein